MRPTHPKRVDRRSRFLSPVAAAFGATLLAGACANETRPPNIVLIMADDLGYAELGCYGQEKIRTPRIDQMAVEGMRFTDHYSGSAVCAPSRCILLTGQHSGHAFIRDNGEMPTEGQRAIPDGTETMAEVLARAGYRTGAFGKWGLGGPDSEGEPNRQGFEQWLGYLCQRHAHNHYPRYLWKNGEKIELEGNDRGLIGEQFSHDLFTEGAIDFLREDDGRPFFLYVPYAVPHLAIQVPDDSLAEYEGQWDDPPYEGGKGYLPHPSPRAGYAAMVTRMDRDVGAILDLLKEMGHGKDTLVIFTSDNGPTYRRLGGSDSDFFASAGEFRGLKGSLHEGGIRVPMIAHWPGRVPAGATSDHVSASWDFLATFADLADLEQSTGGDGLSMAPTLLASGSQPAHPYLYWEFPAYSGQQAIRVGDLKAIRKKQKKPAGKRGALELYDLAKDPGETTDLATLYPEDAAEMAHLMATARTPSAEFPFPALDG